MSHPQLISIKDYLALPTPQIRWLIPNILPAQSFTVLWGPPKSGKTILSLDVALALGTGTHSCLSPVAPVQGQVLYLQIDTGQQMFRSMLDNLDKIRSLAGSILLPNPEDLALQYPLNLLSDRSALYIHSLVAEAQPTLVIVDCLSELGNQDENEQQDMKTIVSALKHLTTFHPSHPCACLLLHHTVKFDYSNAQHPIPSPLKAGRGSGYLAGSADSIWFLHRLTSDQDPHAVLKIVPRFSAPSTHYLKQGPGGWWSKG